MRHRDAAAAAAWPATCAAAGRTPASRATTYAAGWRLRAPGAGN